MILAIVKKGVENEMVKSSEYRAKKYEAKIDGDVMRARYTAQKDIMAEQVTNIQQSLVDCETTVKNVLESQASAVPSIMHGLYMSFGKGLFRIARKFGGSTKTLEGDLLFGRYKSYGLTATVLKAIGDAMGFDTSNWTTGS